MSENVLKATIREERGKGPMRRLRVRGFTPGIIYGKEASTSISLNARELDALLKKSDNQLLSLDLAGKETVEKSGAKMVLIKEIQRNPLNDSLIHVDFFEVSVDKKLKVRVPLRFLGTAKGVKLGGILNYVHRQLEIECLPSDIPANIEVDIADLDEGQSVHVKDLRLKEEIRILNNPRDVLVAVVKPEEEKATAEAEVEAQATAPEKAEDEPKE